MLEEVEGKLSPDQKSDADEISTKVKTIIDEVPLLSNFILGL